MTNENTTVSTIAEAIAAAKETFPPQALRGYEDALLKGREGLDNPTDLTAQLEYKRGVTLAVVTKMNFRANNTARRPVWTGADLSNGASGPRMSGTTGALASTVGGVEEGAAIGSAVGGIGGPGRPVGAGLGTDAGNGCGGPGCG